MVLIVTHVSVDAEGALTRLWGYNIDRPYRLLQWTPAHLLQLASWQEVRVGSAVGEKLQAEDGRILTGADALQRLPRPDLVRT